MSKLKLLQLQLALFFQDIENRPDKFISKMEQVTNNIFDQMPTILPIPPEAPPEIPTVILNSLDGMYTCNISKSRIDFIVKLQDSNNGVSEQLEEFVSKIRSYASVVFGYKNINRFGFVGQYFFETNDPVESIQSKYFKNNLDHFEELNIRYNKRSNFSGLVLNNIVELTQGTTMQNNEMKKGINILRDINNVPDGNELPIEDVFSTIKFHLRELGLDGIMEILQ